MLCLGVVCAPCRLVVTPCLLILLLRYDIVLGQLSGSLVCFLCRLEVSPCPRVWVTVLQPLGRHRGYQLSLSYLSPLGHRRSSQPHYSRCCRRHGLLVALASHQHSADSYRCHHLSLCGSLCHDSRRLGLFLAENNLRPMAVVVFSLSVVVRLMVVACCRQRECRPEDY